MKRYNSLKRNKADIDLIRRGVELQEEEGEKKTVIDAGDVITCPVPHTKEQKCLCPHSSSFLYDLSFQNYHELQPEGDPASGLCSESTPTLHVSKSLFVSDSHVSLYLQRSRSDLQHLTLCSMFLDELVEEKMMRLIATGFRKIVALLLPLQRPHILNETSIICLG